MVTDQQVRRLFTVQSKYEYQYQAADAAGISSKTARKYRKTGKLPSQCKVEHTWSTREDPFADEWCPALICIKMHYRPLKQALQFGWPVRGK